MLEDFPVPASPNSRQLLAGFRLQRPPYSSVNFFFGNLVAHQIIQTHMGNIGNGHNSGLSIFSRSPAEMPCEAPVFPLRNHGKIPRPDPINSSRDSALCSCWLKVQIRFSSSLRLKSFPSPLDSYIMISITAASPWRYIRSNSLISAAKSSRIIREIMARQQS